MKRKGYPEITFQQFINIYPMAPDNWFLYSGAIKYFYKRDSDKRQHFHFICFKTFKDYKTYKKWYKNKDDGKTLEEKRRNQQLLIESFLKDIEDYRKENLEKVKENLTYKLEKEDKDEIKLIFGSPETTKLF